MLNELLKDQPLKGDQKSDIVSAAIATTREMKCIQPGPCEKSSDG